VSVEVTDNTTAFEADVSQKTNVFLRLLLDAIDRKAEAKTPKRKGDLRRNKLKQVLGTQATITWKQDYAAAQEDRQHRNYSTPGTGAHFAENAVKDALKEGDIYARQAGLL
jgi:hypothetical protein